MTVPDLTPTFLILLSILQNSSGASLLQNALWTSTEQHKQCYCWTGNVQRAIFTLCVHLSYTQRQWGADVVNKQSLNIWQKNIAYELNEMGSLLFLLRVFFLLFVGCCFFFRQSEGQLCLPSSRAAGKTDPPWQQNVSWAYATPNYIFTVYL